MQIFKPVFPQPLQAHGLGGRADTAASQFLGASNDVFVRRAPQFGASKAEQLESVNAFRDAIKNNEIEKIQPLLEQLENPCDPVIEQGLSLLVGFAAALNRVDIVEALLAGGRVNPDGPDVYQRTPLMIATEQGYGDIVRVLLDHSASILNENEHKKNVFQIAIDHQKMDVLKILLEHIEGCQDMDITELRNQTLLYACTQNQGAAVDLLLKSGADKNALLFLQKPSGNKSQILCRQTPLMAMVKLHHGDGILGSLASPLGGKLDPDIQDDVGRTALILATDAAAEEEVFQRLFSLKPDMNKQDTNGWTVLHYALFSGQWDIFNLLHSQGASLDVQDNAGETLLTLAAEYGDVSSVEFLLNLGMNPLAPNKDGETALDIVSLRLNVENFLSISRTMEAYKELLPESAKALAESLGKPEGLPENYRKIKVLLEEAEAFEGSSSN